MNLFAKFTHDQFQQNWHQELPPSVELKPRETKPAPEVQNAAAAAVQAAIDPAMIPPPAPGAAGVENRVT